MDLRSGRVDEELSQRLVDVLGDVARYGKPGSLTLTLNIVPDIADNAIHVTAAIRGKKPEPPQGATMFYLDRNKNPVREDPNQMSFDDITQPSPEETKTNKEKQNGGN